MALRNFVPDSKGFLAIANSTEMHEVLQQVVERAKGIAEGLAQDFRVTGDYADSFVVADSTIAWEGEYPGPRAVGILLNTSDHAVAVEFGNQHDHRPHRVLGRTLVLMEADDR